MNSLDLVDFGAKTPETLTIVTELYSIFRDF